MRYELEKGLRAVSWQKATNPWITCCSIGGNYPCSSLRPLRLKLVLLTYCQQGTKSTWKYDTPWQHKYNGQNIALRWIPASVIIHGNNPWVGHKFRIQHTCCTLRCIVGTKVLQAQQYVASWYVVGAKTLQVQQYKTQPVLLSAGIIPCLDTTLSLLWKGWYDTAVHASLLLNISHIWETQIYRKSQIYTYAAFNTECPIGFEDVTHCGKILTLNKLNPNSALDRLSSFDFVCAQSRKEIWFMTK